MKITNLFEDYEYQEKEPLRQYEYWLEYNKQFEGIKHKCLKDYIDNGYNPKDIAVEKVFIYSKLDFNKMKIVSKLIEQICLELINSNIDILDVSSLSVSVIIYHGLGNAAGWASSYKENPAIMLGVEKIVELGWDDEINLKNLIYHEYAHLIHEHLKSSELEPYDDNYKRWINRIYIEGFATYFESVLSGTVRRIDWMKKCQNKSSLLKEELFNRLKHEQSCQDFFGDWYQVYGLSDTGYFLGYEYIKELMKLYDIKFVAKLSFFEIEKSLFQFLRVN